MNTHRAAHLLWMVILSSCAPLQVSLAPEAPQEPIRLELTTKQPESPIRIELVPKDPEPAQQAMGAGARYGDESASETRTSSIDSAPTARFDQREDVALHSADRASVAISPQTVADASEPLALSDQSLAASDVQLLGSIRRALRKLDTSFYGQNVKVIVRDGMVTLRGIVADQRERQAIEAVAVRWVGLHNVVSALEVME